MAGPLDPNGALAAPGPEPPADAALVGYLERDQLTADTAIPLPRAPLSRRAKAGLWLLRIAVILIGAMVVYTFAAKLA